MSRSFKVRERSRHRNMGIVTSKKIQPYIEEQLVTFFTEISGISRLYLFQSFLVVFFSCMLPPSVTDILVYYVFHGYVKQSGLVFEVPSTVLTCIWPLMQSSAPRR